MKKQGWGYARLDSGGGPLREDHLDGAESFEQKVLTNAGAGWAWQRDRQVDSVVSKPGQ